MEDRLYKFARLVDAGSFTKAAQDLHLSQPALTTAIKKLERELQAELLIRDSHTFRLTAAGTVAYDTAKELSTQTKNLKLRILENTGVKVKLNLGMIDSIADMLFVHGDNLKNLEEETHLSLTVDNTTKLITYVEHDKLDIALVATPSIILPALMAIDLGHEPLVLVAGPTHAKAAKKGIDAQELHHFLSYNQNSRTQRLIGQHFARHGIELFPTFYSTSPEIMLQLVLTGRGTAVLPYLLVKPYIAGRQLTPISINRSPVVSRNIASVHRAGRSLPDQATALLGKARLQLSQLSAEAKTL